MRHFGLLGKKLGHSFSKDYFDKKWQSENIHDCRYELYEVDSLQALSGLLNSDIEGLNVTIPYKHQIIPLLDELTPLAVEIQSVNCIKKLHGKWIGHNTDSTAFFESLKQFLPPDFHEMALILGTGGSSKAVQWALKKMNIPFDLASESGKGIPYPLLLSKWNKNWKLIVNTTPLGMWPKTDDKPSIPYSLLNKDNYLYDLVYNPENTLFLKSGAELGSKIKNGLEMLHLQADKSWQFWNE